MARIVREALLARDEGHELPFKVLAHDGVRVVGSTWFLDTTPAHRALEIWRTRVSPGAWRTPVDTECKYLLLRHAFDTLGMIRVQLKTDSRNTGAQRAIERLGAAREGVLRHHRIMPDGYLRDFVYYRILAAE